MTQEHKDLLLKDLCARLPYGVKVKLGDNPNIFDLEYRIKFAVMYGDSDKLEDILDITNIKPYLYPLLSMTEEQKEEYVKLQQRVIYNGRGLVNLDVMKYVDWCYKHHIDINDLIPKGLAIDATVLNIY